MAYDETGQRARTNKVGMTFDEWYMAATLGRGAYPKMYPTCCWTPVVYLGPKYFAKRGIRVPSDGRWFWGPRPLSTHPQLVAERRAYRLARTQWREGIDPTEIAAAQRPV
jgi:hypothetical protein